MATKWIFYGLLILAFIIIMNLVGPFKGSTNSDFPDDNQPRNSNPLSECPDLPNCIRLSIPVAMNADLLLSACNSVLKDMGAKEIESDSQSLQIDAVFQIPVFGFRDDFSVGLTKGKNSDESILHLSSRSRTGRSDLGVNRRRVHRFLKEIRSDQ